MQTSPALGSFDLPRLALTMGDPSGIGSEVILKALADPTITQNCHITVIGSQRLLEQTYASLQHHQNDRPFPLASPQSLRFLEVELPYGLLDGISLGTGNAASGAASFAYLAAAIDYTLAGKFAGIVTAPIAKSAWSAAGHYYPGQTELLAAKAGVERVGMLFVARSPHTGWTLRTLLATTHIPLRQVADALTPALLTTKLDLLIESLRQDFGVESPRIAIAGLNPHSGEQGQLGQEEQDWLIPWLRQEQQQRTTIQLEGPVPPDTLWVRPGRAWYGSTSEEFSSIPPAHDAYIALYHDQGLIPVKLMAFDRAINTSIGLPFVRTSPDHGTAFDIAGRGVADATSLKAAIQLAIEMVQRRSGIFPPKDLSQHPSHS